MMTHKLKDDEMQATTKLIFEGLSMAKSSMEQILQSPIAIKQIDYGNEVEKVGSIKCFMKTSVSCNQEPKRQLAHITYILLQ